MTVDEIIDFINQLMDDGLYDDLMLNIVDNDAIYLHGSDLELFEQIEQITHHLSLPYPSREQAKWLITLDTLSPFLVMPF